MFLLEHRYLQSSRHSLWTSIAVLSHCVYVTLHLTLWGESSIGRTFHGRTDAQMKFCLVCVSSSDRRVKTEWSILDIRTFRCWELSCRWIFFLAKLGCISECTQETRTIWGISSRGDSFQVTCCKVLNMRTQREGGQNQRLGCPEGSQPLGLEQAKERAITQAQTCNSWCQKGRWRNKSKQSPTRMASQTSTEFLWLTLKLSDSVTPRAHTRNSSTERGTSLSIQPSTCWGLWFGVIQD